MCGRAADACLAYRAPKGTAGGTWPLGRAGGADIPALTLQAEAFGGGGDGSHPVHHQMAVPGV